MRFKAFIGEVCRDVATGTSRTLALWFALSLILGSLTVIDALTVSRLVHSARQFQRSGAATVVMAAPGAIDGLACDALSRIPGVEASGAVQDSTAQVKLATLPGTPVPEYTVSPGFSRVLESETSSTNGVTVPDDLLSAVGDSRAAPIATDHGMLPVAGSYEYPEDGRRPGFDWAVLESSASSSTRFDECWATSWPQLVGLRQLLLSTLDVNVAASIDPTSIETSQLNARLGYQFDGSAQYRTRVSIYVPVVGLLAGFLLAALSVRIRRLELAARLHDGTRRHELHWLIQLENVSWALPAGLVGVCAGLAIAIDVGPPDARTFVAAAAATAVATLAGVSLGTATGVVLLREAHLFKYFKDR